MKDINGLLACLPCGEDVRWDWQGLEKSAFADIFAKMRSTMQNPAWHAEGDVWTHTRMVCEALTEIPDFHRLPIAKKQALSLAALLHDVGKITRTRLEDGVLVSPGHGAEGASVVRKLLWQEYGMSGTKEKQNFRETVCLIIRYHTAPLHIIDRTDPQRRARTVAATGENADMFDMNMLCMLAEADVRGRICSDADEKLEIIALGREAAKEGNSL